MGHKGAKQLTIGFHGPTASFTEITKRVPKPREFVKNNRHLYFKRPDPLYDDGLLCFSFWGNNAFLR